ncbi:CGNR zinc finger domain-containing protein [Amycolatopsis sp. NPDC051903]|uniref:CGNR zinc finger domain-containing protein n=1 Tax=Amycolatopsis sp. NPDC051903 TaxID=3363936 RepID=UPI0037B405FE
MLETDERLLLDLLNTTPIVDGEPTDELAAEDAGLRWLTDHGQPESAGEWRTLLDVRSALQDVIRGDADPRAVGRFIDGVGYRARLGDEGVEWSLDAPAGRAAAARAVFTWDQLRHSGRLRPCANPDCRRFLIDHSKPNTARWCSMAVCGNRMKARRHYRRAQQSEVD